MLVNLHQTDEKKRKEKYCALEHHIQSEAFPIFYNELLETSTFILPAI